MDGKGQLIARCERLEAMAEEQLRALHWHLEEASVTALRAAGGHFGEVSTSYLRDVYAAQEELAVAQLRLSCSELRLAALVSILEARKGCAGWPGALASLETALVLLVQGARNRGLLGEPPAGAGAPPFEGGPPE
jgi:hypothetical protein